jgi:two-component sensor histidine kinase
LRGVSFARLAFTMSVRGRHQTDMSRWSDVSGTDWRLVVSDNGSGKPDGVFAQPKTGLGTGVVKALAKQLDAQVVTLSDALGTKVSVTHATFVAA